MNQPSQKVSQLIKNLTNPWKLSFFLLLKLPSLFFWKIRVVELNPNEAAVTIPFNWWTQNPFRSVYFSALLGAAEFSTGILALIAVTDTDGVSMLVTRVEADFIKKAKGRIVFTCEEGEKIQQAVKKAMETNEGQQVTVQSIGKMENETVVCKVSLTWSFKKKVN